MKKYIIGILILIFTITACNDNTIKDPEEQQPQEFEQQNQEQEMCDNWEQLGKDEMENWNRDFPNWQWNID